MIPGATASRGGYERLLLLAIACLAALAGCDSSVPAADSRPAPSTSATATAPSAYAERVLADAPRALWTLGALAEVGPDLIAADLGSQELHAYLVGEAPAPATGPRFPHGPTAASRFDGTGVLRTPLSRGFTGREPFTVEVWLRTERCAEDYQHLAGTARVRPRVGREGLDIVTFPGSTSTSCGVGAEWWSGGVFRGGCRLPERQSEGTWAHVAFTYANRTMRCYADGQILDEGAVRPAEVPDGGVFGIGGTGSGYGRPVGTVSMSHLAVYDRALPAEALAAHVAAAGPQS